MLNARSTYAVLLAIVLGLSSQHVRGQTKPATQPTGPLRVLFIGDGYTSANGGLDQVVRVLAKGKGRAIECVASTSFGKSLAWHWETGAAKSLIGKGNWTHIVLQGADPRNAIEREKLLQTLRLYDKAIDQVGARPVLLATWGSAALPELQRALTEPIEQLAEELDVKLAPVGVAGERVSEESPKLTFRAAEGGAPPPAGTYLAACVLYGTITGDSAEDLSASVQTTGRSFVLASPDARVLQRSADSALDMKRAAAADATTPRGSKRVVYIVDATGTMLGIRFRLAQAQVNVLLAELNPTDRFNVVIFRGGDSPADWTHPFSDKLVLADRSNVQKAGQFVASHNVFPKGTNPIPALRIAFLQKPDVINFLSDGQFNNIAGYDQVREEARRLNSRRIPINTFVFPGDSDEKAREVMTNIALDSGGTSMNVTDKDLKPATAPAEY